MINLVPGTTQLRLVAPAWWPGSSWRELSPFPPPFRHYFLRLYHWGASLLTLDRLRHIWFVIVEVIPELGGMAYNESIHLISRAAQWLHVRHPGKKTSVKRQKEEQKIIMLFLFALFLSCLSSAWLENWPCIKHKVQVISVDSLLMLIMVQQLVRS